MALATAEAIRDKAYGLLEGLTPTLLGGNKFLRIRNEDAADPEGWAEKNSAAAFRRFQIRQVGTDILPDVSNCDFEEVEMTLAIRVFYPQNSRTGPANAMDRDDAMNADWKAINYVLGIYGRANFSGSSDCTPLGCEMEKQQGNGIDYLVVTARFRYKRALT